MKGLFVACLLLLCPLHSLAQECDQYLPTVEDIYEMHYRVIAACVGLERLKHIPNMIILHRLKVPCNVLLEKKGKNGKRKRIHFCRGVYNIKLRTITVSIHTKGVTDHELLHDVLRQVGRSDPYHHDPEWQYCLPVKIPVCQNQP